MLRRFMCWLGWHEFDLDIERFLMKHIEQDGLGSIPFYEKCKHCGRVK